MDDTENTESQTNETTESQTDSQTDDTNDTSSNSEPSFGSDALSNDNSSPNFDIDWRMFTWKFQKVIGNYLELVLVIGKKHIWNA